MNLKFFRDGFKRVGFQEARLTRAPDTNDWLTEWSRREAHKAIDEIARERAWQSAKSSLKKKLLALWTAVKKRALSIASPVHAAIKSLYYGLTRRSNAGTAEKSSDDLSGDSSSRAKQVLDRQTKWDDSE